LHYFIVSVVNVTFYGGQTGCPCKTRVKEYAYGITFIQRSQQ